MKPEDEIYRKLIYDTAAHRIPFTIMCNLTHRCPLGCKHCYVVDPEGAGEELTLAEYESLFDDLAAAGTLFLTFSGGDPLCRDDFLDIVAAGRERHFAVRVFTGALPMDESMARELAALHPIAVEISLHAATPRLHDDFVGAPGTWEHAVAATRWLTEAGTRVVLKMNLMNFNCHELRELYELAASLGAEFRYSPYVSVANDGDPAAVTTRMSDEQLLEYFRTVKEWVPSLREGEVCDEEIASSVRYNERALSCLAGFNNCSIDPYGNVWPCVSLPIDLGNLREKSFDEIWRGERAEYVRGLGETVSEECAGCELDRYCFRCPAFSMLEEGDIKKRSYEHCRVARAAREVLKRPLR
ncbi:MAG: radical SAM protein [Candidatus Zixiibacteriota bacterium]|jgi:radical SAM protein with 4Fe4S-binding SPASM domain